MTTTRNRTLGRASLGVTLFGLAAVVALGVTASGCVVDTGPGSGYGPGYGHGGCLPDLLVGWQLQDSAGAAVTCTQAGAARVTATVNGYDYSQTCLPSESVDQLDVPLAAPGSFSVTVSLYAADGTSLATPQTYSPPLQITSCYTTSTPSPAILVVSPPPS
jgi:hypothetical protein